MTGKKGQFILHVDKFNWKNWLVAAILAFYIVLMGVWFSGKGSYENDFLAFWGAGKLADEKGYAAVYDLDSLNQVQVQELHRVSGNSPSTISTLPAALFSFFILPFQLLSKFGLDTSFWIWTLLNLAALIGYLIFSLKKFRPNQGPRAYYLLLMLCAFPVLDNIANGQVEVLLFICAGEFIRNAIDQKPFLSGLWLGGFLLKPQILILILPILLIMRYWKVFSGFLISAGVIIITSFCLLGLSGFSALLKLWTGYAGGIATSVPEAMINWRMLGLLINSWTGTSAGWWVTGAGSLATLAVLYLLLRHAPAFGTPHWGLCMLGVFSATLAVTWHSHYHMALALLPLILYAAVQDLLPEKLTFAWVVATPLAWLAIVLAGVMSRSTIGDYQGTVITLSGFLMNLVLLSFVFFRVKKKNSLS